MSKSTRKRGSRKAASGRPPKPYPKFPLTPHPGGAWQKKILGKIHYFGRWGRRVNGKMERLPDDGWREALELYKAQADDLHAGRTPRVKKTGEGLKLADLCNHFLTAKLGRKQSGRITALTFEGHQKTTDLLIAQFGKDRLVDDLGPEDFQALLATMSERWGLVRLGNQITAARSVFNWGAENIKGMPKVQFGSEFKPPAKDEIRRYRAKNGKRMLEAEQLRRLLDALEGKEVVTSEPEKITLEADSELRAMVLLGINCGFNNKDCADLPLEALDLERRWIDFPRPKTGIERRCPLWPETVAAIRAAIAERPEPRCDVAEGLVFVTTRGRPWISRGQANPVSVAARTAMKAVGIHREGIGFATLRHVFRTVADGCRDQVAINHVMGHVDPTMGAVYRERIDDGRLVAVAEHVRQWLFGTTVQ